MLIIHIENNNDENNNNLNEKQINSKSLYVQPLETKYNVEIINKYAFCKLTQVYDFNLKNDIQECVYKFPLDYNSALCKLTIETPREIIIGMLKEKNEATQIYEEAKKENKQVFIVEEYETDRDICKLKFGNILKDDKIIINYTYVTELSLISNESTLDGIFYIPTFISPRYKGEIISKLDGKINCSIKINNYIPSEIITQNENMRMKLDTENKNIYFEYEKIGIIDEEIQIKFSVEKIQQECYKFESEGYTFVCGNILPKIKSEIKKQNKLTFILDCSGSMEGDRISKSSKAIIHCLNLMKVDSTEYLFNIIRYGTNVECLYGKLISSFDSKRIDEMIEVCKDLQADLGGTETLKALESAIKFADKTILITDGDTSNNDVIHNFASKFTCLNILGIGSNINKANIVDLARKGNGIAFFDKENNNIKNSIEMLFRSCNSQPIINVTNNLLYNNDNDNNNEISLTTNYPIISNHIYSFYGLTKKNVSTLNIYGENEYCNIVSDYLLKDISLNLIDKKYELACLITRRLIQQNENIDKNYLIKLSTIFNIMTPYTSFVAVGQKVDINVDINRNENNKHTYSPISQKLKINCNSIEETCFTVSPFSVQNQGASINNNLYSSIDKVLQRSETINLNLNTAKSNYVMDTFNNFSNSVKSLFKSSNSTNSINSINNNNNKMIENDEDYPVTTKLKYSELINKYYNTTLQCFTEDTIKEFKIPKQYTHKAIHITLWMTIVIKHNYSYDEFNQFMNLICDIITVKQYHILTKNGINHLIKYMKSLTENVLSNES